MDINCLASKVGIPRTKLMRRLNARMSYLVRKASLWTVCFSVVNADWRRHRTNIYGSFWKAPTLNTWTARQSLSLDGSVEKGANHGMFFEQIGSALHRVAEAASCRPGQRDIPKLLRMTIRAPCLISLRVRPSPSPLLLISPLPTSSVRAQLLAELEDATSA